MKASETHPNVYRIGAVANITGLSTHTIRAWERRYGMELSNRSDGGTRLYPETSVKRLSLIKNLLDQGESISMVCNLTDQELKSRLEEHGPIAVPTQSKSKATGPIRFVVLGQGTGFSQQHYKPNAFVSAQLQFHTEDKTKMEEYLENTPQQPHCGIICCDMIPTQQPNTISELTERFPGIEWFVIFELGSKRELLILNEKGIRTLRGPIPDIIAIDFITSILQPSTTPELDQIEPELSPKPIFTTKQLNQLADLPTTIKCECPSHMSAIIHSLNTFEKYCKTCENESEEDADLHANLAQETAKARATMEQALMKVCAHDNIRVD